MEWSSYFKTIEFIHKIKLDSTIKDTIKENYLFTNDDIREQTSKLVLAYYHSKYENK